MECLRSKSLFQFPDITWLDLMTLLCQGSVFFCSLLDFTLWILVFASSVAAFFRTDIMGFVPAEMKSKERSENTMSILSTTNLTKLYGSEPNIVKALDNVSISIEPEEFVAVIGTSGSGKSTLLHMLGGLDRPTSGSVNVDKFDLGKLSDEDLTVFRRQRIGFIFQNYNLVPILNVYENIVMPIQLDGKKPDQEFIQKIAALLGLEKKLLSMPNTLSGGQQQRVAIARALASKPAIILADEPTGNLDSKTSNEVIELLKVTGKKFHQTIVMITHNPEIAEQADRRLCIEDGRIRQ